MPRDFEPSDDLPVRVPRLDLDGVPCVLSMWLVRRGQWVAAGERLGELLAGDVLIDVVAPANGNLISKAVAENSAVLPGQVLAWIRPESAPAGR